MNEKINNQINYRKNKLYSIKKKKSTANIKNILIKKKRKKKK